MFFREILASSLIFLWEGTIINIGQRKSDNIEEVKIWNTRTIIRS